MTPSLARAVALDHLTAIELHPDDLAREAAIAGCDSICLFLHAMAVLPRLPDYDLVADRLARRRLRGIADAAGVRVDLAYPFTISAREAADSHIPALDAAAELGAGAVNTLVYFRDSAARADAFGGFCDLAAARGLRVAIEFFPPSSVGDLDAALRLAALHPAAGVNVDALHFFRTGGDLATLASAPRAKIIYAQLCDGPDSMPEDDRAAEAAQERLPPGEGAFDLAGFLAALPRDTALSVEVPQDSWLRAGQPAAARIGRAVQAAKRIVTISL